MEIKNDLQAKLQSWAQDAVTTFNEVSIKTGTQYIQQSPLNCINKRIETMVVGINPGSAQPGITTLSAEEFLAGNTCWNNRFENEAEGSEVSKEWTKFFGNAHYFICGDKNRHIKGFDDDSKTVWTNLTPFATVKANQLKGIHYETSLPLLLQLIRILSPKRIVLLGSDAFNRITNYSKANVQREKVVRDKQGKMTLEIGTIDGIPAIQLPHPSNNWGCHNLIAPIFVRMWEIVLNEKLSLRECAAKMRSQLTRLEPAED